MAKVGRKPVEDPRKVLSIRMNGKELGRLRSYADKHSITVTQAIIRGINLMIEQEAKG